MTLIFYCLVLINFQNILFLQRLLSFNSLALITDPVPISIETITHTWSDFGFGKFGRLYNQAYFVDPCDEKGEDSEECFLKVFEVQDLTDPIKKIPLPSLNAFNDEGGMATCKHSNSLYLWQSFPVTWPEHPDIWRLVPNGDGGFEVLEWPIYYEPSDDFLDVSAVSSIRVADLSVLDDGNLLVLRNVYGHDNTEEEVDNILSIHKPDGSIIRSMTLLYDTRLSNVTMKSNGNFVYAQVLDCLYNILETDKDGKAFRNFRFDRDTTEEVTIGCKQLFLDSCDRVIFHDGSYKLIFLDCELNLLGEIEILQMKLESVLDDYDYTLYHAHFDKDTNEMIVIYSFDQVLFLKLTL